MMVQLNIQTCINDINIHKHVLCKTVPKQILFTIKNCEFMKDILEMKKTLLHRCK